MSYIVRAPHFDPGMIAQSGQCFRMTQTAPGVWRLIAGDDVVAMRARRDGGVTFSCTEEAFMKRWQSYFDLDADYDSAIARIPPEDAFLREAVAAGDGLRILRQDPWEMLVSFIISQRKTIPAIRACIEKLCTACGKPLRGGGFGFPTPRALAALPMADMQACGVGYRGRYLHDTAMLCASNPLPDASLPDDALLTALMAYPGVGVKVARCVMLFGYHRLSAAPVDVWIQRVIDQRYGGCSPFPGYGEDAGLYQQYLFYYQQHVLAR